MSWILKLVYILQIFLLRELKPIFIFAQNLCGFKRVATNQNRFIIFLIDLTLLINATSENTL